MRLFLHHLRTGWKPAILAGLGLLGFQILVARVFVTIGQTGQAQAVGSRLIPEALRTFLGIDRMPLNSLNGFFAVSWQHPFLLAAAVAVTLVIVSSCLAGELEKRTLALLLARPIGRVRLVVTAALAVAFWCAVVVLFAAAGCFIGADLFDLGATLHMNALMRAAASCYLLLLAVGGIGLVFSALANDRGDAIGWSVTVILLMYVWNFIAQAWPPAHASGRLSLFAYYSPTQIFMESADLARDHLVLGVVAGGCLLLAAAIFRVRDLNL